MTIEDNLTNNKNIQNDFIKNIENDIVKKINLNINDINCIFKKFLEDSIIILEDSIIDIEFSLNIINTINSRHKWKINNSMNGALKLINSKINIILDHATDVKKNEKLKTVANSLKNIEDIALEINKSISKEDVNILFSDTFLEKLKNFGIEKYYYQSHCEDLINQDTQDIQQDL